MALKECHECQGKMSDKAKVCPHCGAPNAQLLSQTSQERTGITFLIFYIAAHLCFYYLVYKNWNVAGYCGFTFENESIYKRLIINTFTGVVAIPLQIFDIQWSRCPSFNADNLVTLSRVFASLVVGLLATSLIFKNKIK